jgi:hypothetical protein
MIAIPPTRLSLIDQLNVGLVDEAAGIERSVAAPAAQLLASDAAQLRIDQLDESVEGVRIAGAYVGLLPFSESRSMSPRSLATLVLVPKVLRPDSLLEVGDVTGYRYSAADGPRPSTVIATLAGTFSSPDTDERIRRRFLREGFTSSGEHRLTRTKEELTWSYLPGQSGRARLEIALLTYVQ